MKTKAEDAEKKETQEVAVIEAERSVPAVERANSPIENMMTLAIEKGITAETMEKFVAMRNDELARIAKADFDRAMSSFMGDCPIIEKTKEALNNGKLMYKYAPLDEIVRQIQPHLKANGLSFGFNVTQDKETLTVTCTVTHFGGHSQSSQFQVPSTGGTSIMSGPQKFASALTFAKRYALSNSLGIVTGDEDTDAPKTKDEDLATQEQKDRIDALATQAGLPQGAVEERFRKKYLADIKTMTRTQALGVINSLELMTKK